MKRNTISFADSFDTLNPDFGSSHTKTMQAQPIQACMIDVLDDDSHLVKCRSDIDLLLYDKSIQTKIGADAVRNYIDNLNSASNTGVDTSSFSDSELFSLIDPKDINTITDAYEYAQYVKKHSDDIKARYEQYTKLKKQQKAFEDSLKLPSDNATK